jgi:hypothetical protein
VHRQLTAWLAFAKIIISGEASTLHSVGQALCGKPQNIVNNDQIRNVSAIPAISLCYMLSEAVTCGSWKFWKAPDFFFKLKAPKFMKHMSNRWTNIFLCMLFGGFLLSNSLWLMNILRELSCWILRYIVVSPTPVPMYFCSSYKLWQIIAFPLSSRSHDDVIKNVCPTFLMST